MTSFLRSENCQFGRDRRLLQAKEFEQVFTQARYKVQQANFLILAIPGGSRPRLGLVVAKRKVRLAHDRNRIKRIIRENFRQQAAVFPAVDLVVLAKAGADRATPSELSAELLHLWRQLQRRTQGNPSQSH